MFESLSGLTVRYALRIWQERTQGIIEQECADVGVRRNRKFRSEIWRVDDVGTFDNPCGWRMGRRTMSVTKEENEDKVGRLFTLEGDQHEILGVAGH
jgi:hypothetical protein